MHHELHYQGGHMRSKWMRFWGLLVSIALFLTGIWTVPLAVFGPDRTFIPGDMGDARFNNYILEHFHRWSMGEEPSFWDAPFMYPWKNVVALSDNLFGTAPFYSVFRHSGLSRESAFQAWVILMFVLNYWACLFALRRWSGNLIIAASGAYIFAFGIYNIGQMNNLQVMPKFMVPLVFFFLWEHLRTGRFKWLALTVLGTVYQLYCGLYMGLILIYGLFFMALAHLVVFRSPSYLTRFRQVGFAGAWVATLAGGIALVAPLALPYLCVPDEARFRLYSDILPSLPRPSSFFFAHSAALSWRSLSEVGNNAFPEWWHHFHFMGALPWLAIIAMPILLWKKNPAWVGRRELLAMFLALLLSICFCLNLAGHSLYALVFNVPGYHSIRAADRYINVLAPLFLIVFVLVLRPLFHKPLPAVLLAMLLPVLTVQDNRWEADRVTRYDKYRSQEEVAGIQRRILREYDATTSPAAVAYEPFLGYKVDDEELHMRLITTHISTMLAAQEVGIPVVNAYTGGYPGNYLKFFDHMDRPSLEAWCAFNGTSTEGIQQMHGLPVAVAGVDTVAIRAANGKYVCANILRGDHAIADRGRALEWETFLCIRTVDGRIGLLAHNDRFLMADLEGDGTCAANGSDLGDFALFTPEAQPEGGTLLKAYDGRYLSVDTVSLRVIAMKGVSGSSRFNLFNYRKAP